MVAHHNTQYITIQRSTTQYNTIQYNTVQNNEMQCKTIKYNTISCNKMGGVAVVAGWVAGTSSWRRGRLVKHPAFFPGTSKKVVFPLPTFSCAVGHLDVSNNR